MSVCSAECQGSASNTRLVKDLDKVCNGDTLWAEIGLVDRCS
jgi:hypothetical protein